MAIPIMWTSALLDSSGYASASRSYVDALIDHKYDISLQIVSFENQKLQHIDFAKKIKPFIQKQNKAKIHIIHLTPENYSLYKIPGLYTIGYTTWEADVLPKNWVPAINQVDEVWVPSRWNIDVFRKSGVIKPIYVIPHVFTKPDISKVEKIDLGISDDVYLFYTIGQYIERKNFKGLLKAYLTEFSEQDNVCLALKTYRLNCSIKEQDIIKEEVFKLKSTLRLEYFPPIKFFGSLLSKEQINFLHQRGNCFVLPTRGEGFGIPFAEAMSMGNPTIATNYSGHLEFMNNKNSFLIDYQETPVADMIFSNYYGYMSWAEPSIGHLKQKMRWIYNNKEVAKHIGLIGQQDVLKQLSPQNIVSLIEERLIDISRKL